MKTFDIVVLVLGYTLFWIFLIWTLMGIVAILFWYSLFFPKKKKSYLKKKETNKK
ncbi:hypothetical protein [Leptospira kirschneri]|uniref:hypothetical protein n=1 Tax=Leptospira kirschneri TaxID=29507 RepID=UPI000297A0E0|nr:hypothetical protein [Leptospira kirschneri]EKQ85868.1 hypothetical protein LEP1GSC064_2694 [Leptospira kirschneri serovar Grippotyphosa str. Moskva]EKR09014.1 hypothetical protein LEP1GSC122_0812 [Leptospira kirschneri serovar Valbuzzi str. 200702274]EMK04325.1 hypothetical protein LEP1GSC176_0994 [Leptospira kirschneri str. MMD1493]EPG50717.1 hypothetical protein LEP1GSC049_3755 [Leptospira kirschneri serovar Cynopteri str. 3522 CT]